MQYHKSVLLKESIDALEVSNGGVYVDTTFGGGGHSREILSRVQNCSLYSFDQDEDALENELDDERLTLIHSNFSELENSLKLYRVDKVDGVLADLGVSSHQFDSEQRGFSIRFDGPLDMRMSRNGPTASDFVNHAEENLIAEVIYKYGEESKSKIIAKRIVESRKKSKIDQEIESFSVSKAISSMRSSAGVLYLVDGKENITDQDLHLISLIISSVAPFFFAATV